MRTISSTVSLIILLLFTSDLLGQPLSDNEREYVILLLEENSKSFLASIENVSDAQWIFKPATTSWSVGEISEHITLSEDLLFSIAQKTLQAPADYHKAKSLEGSEQEILDKISDRSVKAQAPEVIRPSGKFASKRDLVAAFQSARKRTIDYVKTTTDPLKNHVAIHPAVGELTVYQWIVFIAGHAKRHIAQLQEVKTNAAYPKI
jgi:hypothetical protein